MTQWPLFSSLISSFYLSPHFFLCQKPYLTKDGGSAISDVAASATVKVVSECPQQEMILMPFVLHNVASRFTIHIQRLVMFFEEGLLAVRAIIHLSDVFQLLDVHVHPIVGCKNIQ